MKLAGHSALIASAFAGDAKLYQETAARHIDKGIIMTKNEGTDKATIIYKRSVTNVGLGDTLEVLAQTVVSRCSIFFVRRKDARLRLIFDPRTANCKCEDPPHTALPSPSSLAQLETHELGPLEFASGDIEVFLPAAVQKNTATLGPAVSCILQYLYCLWVGLGACSSCNWHTRWL